MAGFPYDVKVEVSLDPQSAATPTWIDVTDDCKGFTTTRGRRDNASVCGPGRVTVTLDNADGTYDPKNPFSPFFTKVRPNRRVRISAQLTEFTSRVYLGYGFVDRWTRRPVGDGPYGNVEITATDRFKLFSRRTYSGTRPAENASARMSALLSANGVLGGDLQVNVGGYNSRSLITSRYAKADVMQALNEVVLSDGGVLFMDGAGRGVWQTTRYRTDDIRATNSNGTFGNTPGAIELESDIEPGVDDQLTSNLVRVTDGNGKEHVAQDVAYSDEDGLLEYDLGATLLLPADAGDRAADLLTLRKYGLEHFERFTIDALTGDDQMQQALAREISDRISIALLIGGGPDFATHEQFIEGVEHNVTFGRDAEWRTTFPVSAT